MTESTHDKAIRNPGKATISKVLSELESTVADVTELAGSGRDFTRAGERLTRLGASPELVALAVELASARS